MFNSTTRLMKLHRLELFTELTGTFIVTYVTIVKREFGKSIFPTIKYNLVLDNSK